MKELFVCEKPSVARDLATAISGGYKEGEGHYIGNDGKLYTFAFGHLVNCVSPESINEEWGWKGNVNKLPFFIKNIPLTLIDNPGVKKLLMTFSNVQNLTMLIVLKLTDSLSKNEREAVHMLPK